MQLEIRHQIRFHYDAPVFVDPMAVRLRPRGDHVQQVLDHSLSVVPEPAILAEGIDVSGNVVTTACFEGRHEQLTLVAASVLIVRNPAPFDYYITDRGVQHLPVRYLDHDDTLLRPYLARAEPAPSVDAFSRNVSDQVDRCVTAFGLELARRLHDRSTHVVREAGPAWTPEKTLDRREGACRDLAVLYIDACRAQGLAARFVSGYRHDPGAPDERQMHAWAEIYLPGAGWKGYDPSLGLAVTDRHIAVAIGADPDLAAPTAGTYRGDDVTSRLEFAISVHEVLPAAESE